MDNHIADILEKEKQRQEKCFEFIASENFASDAVRELCGSIFTNKYAEGYPGKRYYNGCENMDSIEDLAIEKLKNIYGCQFANVQPHCGANANTAVFQAFLNPGDRILGMDLAAGGHLSHGAKVNISGKVYESHSYGVNDAGYLDYDSIREKARKVYPKLIIAGGSAYSREINFSKFRAIADEMGALLLVDMAHYSGLIAGGVYPNPVPYADVVTSTTHKTLRGPRGGIILWNNPDYTKRINSAIFPGTQGGPLMNIIAAKAQAFIEADSAVFREYTAQVVDNAHVMCDVFNKSETISVLTGGTDSHIILLDLSKSQYSGREAADLLEEHGITVNKNGIPNDPRSFVETSGIRLGTAAETTRGMKEADAEAMAERILAILED